MIENLVQQLKEQISIPTRIRKHGMLLVKPFVDRQRNSQDHWHNLG
eukprot:SAG31_NODE_1710_length_7473_cov_3.782072_3_plen_46_part_00